MQPLLLVACLCLVGTLAYDPFVDKAPPIAGGQALNSYLFPSSDESSAPAAQPVAPVAPVAPVVQQPLPSSKPVAPVVKNPTPDDVAYKMLQAAMQHAADTENAVAKANVKAPVVSVVSSSVAPSVVSSASVSASTAPSSTLSSVVSSVPSSSSSVAPITTAVSSSGATTAKPSSAILREPVSAADVARLKAMEHAFDDEMPTKQIKPLRKLKKAVPKTTDATLAVPTWAPVPKVPFDYGMHESTFDMLDLEPKFHVKESGIALDHDELTYDHDYAEDLDHVYHYLDYDTSTPHERAHGLNLDVAMHDSVFKYLDQPLARDSVVRHAVSEHDDDDIFALLDKETK